jgi:hypothetical protein
MSIGTQNGGEPPSAPKKTSGGLEKDLQIQGAGRKSQK